MSTKARTGFFSQVLHLLRVKYLIRRKALIISAFLVFIQLATPLTTIVVYAAAVSSNDVGSSAALDPVGNKASRLQTQGSTGVDQSTGALTYSYPLTIPEGRGGMSPKLALSYNSQNNESGWFGYGWNFSIPYIDRTVKVGTDKMYTSPAFVSSLHGELVSSNGSIYEQKVDDGSYAKYTYNGASWQMTDRDGTTYYFGNSYSSRIQDDTGLKIGKWYLTEVRDKFGNGIVYTYTKENGSVYPATISYTEHALAHPLNLVTFSLENRNDKNSSLKYGFRVTETKRIASIKVTTNGEDNSYFIFNYSTGNNGVRSLLQSIEEKHLSTNDDWTTIPKTTFDYENSSTTYTGTITNSNNPYGGNVVIDTNNNGVLELYSAGDGYYPVDINGDYKKDLIFSDMRYNAPPDYNFDLNFSYNVGVGSTNFFLRKIARPYSPYANSMPGGFSAPPLRSVVNPNVTMVPRSMIVDVNGDGFDDIIYNDPYGGNGLAINSSNNTFNYPSTSNLAIDVTSEQIADINGDGLQDKISKTFTATSTLFSVYLNNGTSYATSTDFVYDAKIASSPYDLGVRFIDINNDGLVDVIRSYNSSYTTTGTPLCTGGEVVATPQPINQSINEFAINSGTSFITTSSTFSGYLVSYSGCHDGFGNPYLLIKNTKEYDTNGDLSTDYDGSLNTTVKQDVLKKITTSLGATNEISYTWSSKTGLNPNLPIPMYIVATTTDKLSISDVNPHKVEYNFFDGAMYFDSASPRDHKFAGFGKVTVTDGYSKITTYYHQGNSDDYTTGEKSDSYYGIGKAYRVDTFDTSLSTTTLISKNLSLYTTYTYASSSFTYLDSQVSSIYNADGSYLSSATQNIYDPAKRLIKTTYAYGDIEPFISFASSTIIDKGTDLLTTSYEYSNNRPQRIVKQTTVDYTGKNMGDVTYYYDNLPRGLVDKGAATSVATTVYNSDGTVNSTSTSQTAYDPTGNVILTIDNLNRSTKFIYSSDYYFPTAKIDALNGTTTFSYDPYTLNLLTTKTPDGITSVKETDGFGKVTRSYLLTASGGISDEVRISYVYGGGVSVYIRKLGDSGMSARSLQIYDSYGRLIQSKNETTPDSFQTQDTVYDANSNIISTSLPYTTNGYGFTTDVPVNGKVIYSYDGQGRVVTKSTFGTTLTYQYGARSLTVADNASNLHKKTYAYDANGNLTQVLEYNGQSIYTTNYNYTPLNKLSRITDANGNIRNFSYLSSGALVYQEDPHPTSDATFSTYSYAYDTLGNLITKAGALGTTTYAYDSLNRPTVRTLNDLTYGTSTISIVYTGCSNNYYAPCTINRTTSSTTLAYMVSGRLSSESLAIDGKTFVRSYVYDTYGNPTTITYPDNGKAVYTYTLDGKQSTLTYITPSGATKNVVTSSTYNSLGSLSSLTYANGVQMCNSYTSSSTDGVISPKLSKSLYVFNSTGCSSTILNQIELYKDEFTYKDALTPSNILTTYKDIAGVTHTKNDTLTYDALARLTQVSTSYDGGGAVVDTLVYDPIGNIINENDILYRYSQDGAQNAHAVTSIGGMHITYDAQGNRIQVGDSAYAWNMLNQIVSATSSAGTEFYTYDENGERIKKIIKGTTVINQKTTPSASTTAQVTFSQGNFLATVATSSTYIATSTYNRLSALSLLSTSSLTSLVGDLYGSPFTSKYCMSATSTSNRQSCIATTTKQLLANTINSRSTSTVATNGLITDILNIVTGTYLIPTSYAGLATSSIATSATSTFTIDNTLITAYTTFVTTGVMVAMSEYANVPYVSTSTYTTLSLVGLTDTSKVRALLTLSGCTSIITACVTAKKVVFEKYYKEAGYLLSDKVLQEMWYVYAMKARLPSNSNELTSTSTTLGSISIPVVTSINVSSATSTYYAGKYFTTEYSDQNLNEPRLQYFNIIPYYINQTAFSELSQAGISQSTIDNYQALIADLLGTRYASSTEYIAALKTIAQYDKKVTLSATTSKELYLVAIGAALIPNNATEYITSSIIDLTSYLSIQSVYGAYGSTLSNTTSGCYGGTYTGGFARCMIRATPFSLPVATTSQVTYFLSVTAPSPIEFILNAGESIDPRKGTDNFNYGVDIPIVLPSRYAPATLIPTGFLDYISGTISADTFTQTIDVTPTIVKQKASSTEPAVILLLNRSGWTSGEQYAYQSQTTNLKAYVNTPRLTLASTTLVAGVTNATSSSFTTGIISVIASYFGESSDSASSVTGTASSSLVFISPESSVEFASTTLRNAYDLSKVFLSTTTSQCITDASTTECDKQVRKTWFRQVVMNLSGFTPSQAATEEFWMVHKGLLMLPNVNYASTTASTTVAGYYATSTNGTAYVGAYVISIAPGYYTSDYIATTTATSTGGTITTSGTDYVHTFTATGTFTPSSNFNAQVLVVGGGGGGGGASTLSGSAGGGGAGGYQYNPAYNVSAQPYSVIVGSGGAGGAARTNGTAGASSTFATITAGGGGYGSASVGNGGSGASGGGAGAFGTTYSGGSANQGSNGGGGSANAVGGGGGGGAIAAGTGSGTGSDPFDRDGGFGGNGTTTSISGVATSYAGGGGGGGNDIAGSSGGTGGGGAGGNAGGGAGIAGTSNTGGGGGGGSQQGGTVQGAGGNGGSGVVIVRYNPSVPGHWLNVYYATTTTFYISSSTALGQVIVASTSVTSFPVFSRSNLPSSLSTATSYTTSTTTIPGYWATQVTLLAGPTGGTVTTTGTTTTHVFTSSGTFTSSSNITAEVLVVGGGGGGGGASTLSGAGGGGGAGGFKYTSAFSITPQSYSVTIGTGGIGGAARTNGTAGASSTFATITAGGGGYGSASVGNGGSGASGGGAGASGTTYAGGIGNQGNNGGGGSAGAVGGGAGGGATSVGTGSGTGSDAFDRDGGIGGNGTSTTITGTTTVLAGGGGGGGNDIAGSSGGTGGGGAGGNAGGGAGIAGTSNTGGGGGGGSQQGGTVQGAGGNGGSGVVIIRYDSSSYQATTTPVYIATSTIIVPSIHLDLVPSGLLSDIQYNTLYSTSTFALATSTKAVSEDTYNELLRTPIRMSSDVDTVFDYALPYATSTCPGQSATSSCVVTALKSKVKDTVSIFSGFVLSDASLEELYKVKNNELSIIPISLATATTSTTTQSVIIPLTPSETYITFATTTGVATSSPSVCAFGVSGSTTKACYIDIPFINSTISSLSLSYNASPTSLATSKLRSTLTITTATTTTGTSTPTITTTIATSTYTGARSATSTFTFDLSSLYTTFLTSSSPTLTLVPDGTATSSTIYTLSTSTLTVTRVITVPRISYSPATLLATPFSRSSIPSFATTTSTSNVDLTSLPPLTFSATFLSPVGRIATSTTIYSGYIVDTTPVPLPSLPQSALSSITYPSATSSISTSTVNTLTVATTTTVTTYTPFSGYQDASSTITTYFTLNGSLVGAYTYQKGNEASTGKLTFIHTNYLGTPVLETDDKGDIVQMDITDVFGNYVMRDQRKDNAYHNKGYTSHEFDDVTGLTYVHARYMDTKMHSFLSADPVIYNLESNNDVDRARFSAILLSPQAQNSYAYAGNNPITNTDPDGKFWWKEFYADWNGYDGWAGIGMKLGEVYGGRFAAQDAIAANRQNILDSSARTGVSPSMYQAIMYEENSHQFPPMNIERRIENFAPQLSSGGVGAMQVSARTSGLPNSALLNDRTNVNAAGSILQGIQAKNGTNPATVGAVYNSGGLTNAHGQSYGQRVDSYTKTSLSPTIGDKIVRNTVSGITSPITNIFNSVSSVISTVKNIGSSIKSLFK